MTTMRWVWAVLLVGCAAESDELGDTTGAPDGETQAQATDDGGPAADDDGPAATGEDDDAADDDGSDGVPGGSDTAADDDAADDGTDAGDDTSGGTPMADPPPTDPDALGPWLQSGAYLRWPAESGVHDSAGPHFGGVRTFVDDVLFESLQAGGAEHPVGAAAVKELYADGDEVRGWSVMVKVQEGAGEDGWYWYELYDGSVLADGVGLGVCTGCHGSGSDFVRSPFPLQ